MPKSVLSSRTGQQAQAIKTTTGLTNQWPTLGYDKEHKAQWLASLDLDHARFTNRREFTAPSLWQQSDTMESWLIHPPTH
jgi:hypothetical protein